MLSTIDKAVDYALLNRTALICPTARAFDVTPRILSRRPHAPGGPTSQQLLSLEQEMMLVDWILEQKCLGHAPTHQQIRKFAAKIRGCSGECQHFSPKTTPYPHLTRFVPQPTFL